MYRFQHQKRISDAIKWKGFEVLDTPLSKPDHYGDFISSTDLANIFQLDQREESLMALRIARAVYDAFQTFYEVSPSEVLSLHMEKDLENRENELEGASINPHPESRMRDVFAASVGKLRGVSATTEYVVDKHYTVFKGKVDVALFSARNNSYLTDRPLAVGINMSITADSEDEEEEEHEQMVSIKPCESVEIKSCVAVATQQSLAGCYCLLVNQVIELLKHNIVNVAIAYAIELRRGSSCAYQLKVDFENNVTTIAPYPRSITRGDTASLLNIILDALCM